MVGSLNWCVRSTRPDLSWDLIELSTKLKSADVEDCNRVAKMLRRLKSKEVSLFYPDMGDLENLELVVFSDAAFSNLDGGAGSTMAYIVFCKVDEKCCPIVWKSNKLQRVVQSSLAAEALALSKGLLEAFYQKSFLQECLGVSAKITAYVDNKGLVENVYSTSLVEDRRLILDLAVIKQMLNKNEVENVIWVQGSDMLANVMTKRTADGTGLLKVMAEGKME